MTQTCNFVVMIVFWYIFIVIVKSILALYAFIPVFFCFVVIHVLSIFWVFFQTNFQRWQHGFQPFKEGEGVKNWEFWMDVLFEMFFKSSSDNLFMSVGRMCFYLFLVWLERVASLFWWCCVLWYFVCQLLSVETVNVILRPIWKTTRISP